MHIVSDKTPGSVVESFSMQVLDEFQSNDFADTAENLLSPTSEISARFRSEPALWHTHIGWLEAHQLGEVLHNVNYDVVPKDPTDKGKGKILRLLHLQRLTFATPLLCSSLDSENQANLGACASMMHRQNKRLLGESLAETAQDAIRLGDF
jgi:hypothetical protein